MFLFEITQLLIFFLESMNAAVDVSVTIDVTTKLHKMVCNCGYKYLKQKKGKHIF